MPFKAILGAPLFQGHTHQCVSMETQTALLNLSSADRQQRRTVELGSIRRVINIRVAQGGDSPSPPRKHSPQEGDAQGGGRGRAPHVTRGGRGVRTPHTHTTPHTHKHTHTHSGGSRVPCTEKG